MKKVGGFVFFLLYLVALFKPLAPFLEYEANRDYFIEVLCSNKAKPELECNGQCALTSKLQNSFADSTLPSTTPPPIVRMDDYPIGFVAIITLKPVLIADFNQVYSTRCNKEVSPGFRTDLIKPPCMA
jgi:hypothetical protein